MNHKYTIPLLQWLESFADFNNDEWKEPPVTTGFLRYISNCRIAGLILGGEDTARLWRAAPLVSPPTGDNWNASDF